MILDARAARTLVHALFITLMLSLLSACGGGGGSGSDYSISLSATSLSFTGAQGTGLAPQTVTVTFRGDGVVVSTLPGQLLPAWLLITQSSQPVNGQVQFSVTASPSAAAIGTHQTTLRFLSGKADGSSVVSADLQISMVVKEGFGITNSSQEYLGIAGTSTPTRTSSTPMPAMTGETVSWTARSTASWLKLDATSGNLKGPITYTLDTGGLPSGPYFGHIIFSDSISARTASVNVSLTLTVPQIVMTPASITINVDANTQPSQISIPFNISDELGGTNASYGYSWNLASESQLVRISKTSGTTSPSASDLVIDLDPMLLNVTKSGQIKTFLDVTTRQNGTSFTDKKYVPVTINIRLPMFGSFFPYVVTPGTSGTVRVIGNDFQDSDLALIRLNGQAPAAVRRISTQEIEIDYTAIAAGQYPLTFQNGLGVARSAAELSVVGPVTIGTGEVSTAGGRKTHLLFDASRGILYATDYTNGAVYRYRWNGSAYTALTPVTIAGVRYIAMSRNNREIFATSEWQGLYSFDASTTSAVTAQLRATNLALACGRMLGVAAPEDGSIYVSPFGNPCAPPNTATALMAVSPMTLTPSGIMVPFSTRWPSLYTSSIATSPNGRYLVSGTSGISGGEDYYLLDIRTNSKLNNNSQTNWLNHRSHDVNDTGTRVLISSIQVRDNLGNTVCNLPNNDVARLNTAGSKAYAYFHVDGGAGRIAVFNTMTAAATCIEITSESVPVPYDMGNAPGASYYDPNFAMALIEDQKKLLLSGSSRIVALTIQ